MKKSINIAVVGLGQVGSYLLNELNTKRKDIELKTGMKINIVAISARNINKKRQFKINKKIFFKYPLDIFSKTNVDILFEAIGLSDGISKKVVETALKKKIHVITPNKALISKHGNYLAKIAELNNVNLEFSRVDVLNFEDKLVLQDKWKSKFDIIVSNPPYVRELEKQQMKPNVLNNEPHLALFVKTQPSSAWEPS